MQMLPSSLLLAQDQGSGKLKKLHVTCSATMMAIAFLMRQRTQKAELGVHQTSKGFYVKLIPSYQQVLLLT